MVRNRKSRIRIILGGLLFLIIGVTYAQQTQNDSSQIQNAYQKLTKVWETQPVFKTPESVVYDANHDVLFISNFNVRGGFVSRGDTTADEFISKVNLNGEIENLKWVTGLLNPCGMAIYHDTLYVVERKRLAAIHIESGTIVRRYDIPGSLFPNDIIFDNKGTGYITDNNNNSTTSIFKFEQGRCTPWISSEIIFKPNGIDCIGNRILVGDARDKSLKFIDLTTQKISPVASFQEASGRAMFDGLQAMKNGGFLTSFWDGPGFWISKSGNIYEIIDTQTIDRPNVNDADWLYLDDQQLLIIPTFFDNRLMAFHLED